MHSGDMLMKWSTRHAVDGSELSILDSMISTAICKDKTSLITQNQKKPSMVQEMCNAQKKS